MARKLKEGRRRTMRWKYVAAMGSLAAASSALAHTGAGDAHGFAHGFWHPLMGLDHFAVMIAIGLWAAQCGGKALWAAPLAFVGFLAFGGVLGMNGIGLGAVETMIAGSVIALGLLIALKAKPGWVGMAAVSALFGVFHGHAHGAEMPVGASGLDYATGFVAATALLHVSGIILGLGLGHRQGGSGFRAAGAAVTLLGVYLTAV
jgi:urease accessory protein